MNLILIGPGGLMSLTCNECALHPCSQIRRRKCSGADDQIPCAHRPSIEHYCDVARAIQATHGLQDSDVRFFLAADEPETYDQVGARPMRCMQSFRGWLRGIRSWLLNLRASSWRRTSHRITTTWMLRAFNAPFFPFCKLLNPGHKGFLMLWLFNGLHMKSRQG